MTIPPRHPPRRCIVRRRCPTPGRPRMGMYIPSHRRRTGAAGMSPFYRDSDYMVS
ncbi:hypothetical protein MMALV_09000 [Candidatus Methanomethylophilus alvi Mx1201]|uniref:Uncharacterized protein n=1 Tax=Methanomethylophilus alvi (strain Mx1201) TaxID=1236689 RepID=M9SJD5_METAX|nr:hypothetical protein MMALV_09000 [Candidatus Methanomethylophilus alvi Mx1201]